MIEKYYQQIIHILGQIKDTQAERIEVAARIVADVIKTEGIVYIFGCGHSHLIGLDCFYRAGGLANVSAMLDTDLMLHNGAAKSSVMEKMPGIAEEQSFAFDGEVPKHFTFEINPGKEEALATDVAIVINDQVVNPEYITKSENYITLNSDIFQQFIKITRHCERLHMSSFHTVFDQEAFALQGKVTADRIGTGMQATQGIDIYAASGLFQQFLLSTSAGSNIHGKRTNAYSGRIAGFGRIATGFFSCHRSGFQVIQQCSQNAVFYHVFLAGG